MRWRSFKRATEHRFAGDFDPPLLLEPEISVESLKKSKISVGSKHLKSPFCEYKSESDEINIRAE